MTRLSVTSIKLGNNYSLIGFNICKECHYECHYKDHEIPLFIRKTHYHKLNIRNLSVHYKYHRVRQSQTHSFTSPKLWKKTDCWGWSTKGWNEVFNFWIKSLLSFLLAQYNPIMNMTPYELPRKKFPKERKFYLEIMKLFHKLKHIPAALWL